MADEKFPSGFIPRVLAYAVTRGLAVDDLIARFDLPKDAVYVTTVDATMTTLRAFGIAASEYLHEPFLGMKIALSPHNAIPGATGTLLRNCATVSEALDLVDKFQRLFSPATKMTVIRRPHEIGFEYSVPGDPLGPGRVNAEWTLVRGVAGWRAATRTHVVPTRVWFQGEPGSTITPLVDFFGTANIEFGAVHDGVVFDPEVGAARMVGANPTVFAVVEKVATGELAALDPNADLLARVRPMVRAALEDGSPSLEAIARQVGLSDRTLQRRIKELGSSFAELVEEERRDLAIQWVTDERMDLEMLPATLGYGQKEAFWRAFKRWTGTTPVRFRKEKRLLS